MSRPTLRLPLRASPKPLGRLCVTDLFLVYILMTISEQCLLRPFSKHIFSNAHLRASMYTCRTKYTQIWGNQKGSWHPQMKELALFITELNTLRDAASKTKSAKAVLDRQEKELALAQARENELEQELTSKTKRKATKVFLFSSLFGSLILFFSVAR